MKNAPPQIKQMMGNLKQSYDQMVTQLPDEPIGKGGALAGGRRRWTRTGSRRPRPRSSRSRTSSDSEVKLKSTVTVAAPPQTINSSGMSVNLKRMTGTGSGNITLDLTKLIGAST